MDRARLCIEQLAGLHAWSCDPANGSALEAFPSLDTPIARDLLLPAFGRAGRSTSSTARTGSGDVARFAEWFTEYAAAALPALTERDMLLHGDIRADNMFFAGDTMKVVDFQFAARGRGAADIAYLVSQGLPTRHEAATTRPWCANTSTALRVSGLPTTRSTRRGGTTATRRST